MIVVSCGSTFRSYVVCAIGSTALSTLSTSTGSFGMSVSSTTTIGEAGHAPSAAGPVAYDVSKTPCCPPSDPIAGHHARRRGMRDPLGDFFCLDPSTVLSYLGDIYDSFNGRLQLSKQAKAAFSRQCQQARKR